MFNGQPTPPPTPSIAATQEPTPTPTAVPIGTTKMPNLEGYTFEDAENLLKQKSENFTVILEKEDYSNKPKGTVIEQYPLADVDVLMNATIKLTISAGPEPLYVPRVTGMSQEDATQQLTAKGFKVVPAYESSEEMSNGQVIRTEPATGESIYEGDIITIVVSTGKNPTYVQMINIVGKTIEEARTALDEAGLSLGEISRDYSETFAEGYIMRQDIAMEDTVLSGTAVNVIVSRGAEEVVTPTPAPTDVPVDNPDVTIEPSDPTDTEITPEPEEPTEPEVTPEPENPEITPEPTPELTGATYYPLSLSTEGKEKPMLDGETVFYYIEIRQNDIVAYTVAEGEISYDEYPEDGFYFKLDTEKYPHLQEGRAYVYLFVGDDGIMVEEWWVDLQEFAE